MASRIKKEDENYAKLHDAGYVSPRLQKARNDPALKTPTKNAA